MYYVVRPTIVAMFGSGLNLYGLFFLVIIPPKMWYDNNLHRIYMMLDNPEMI